MSAEPLTNHQQAAVEQAQHDQRRLRAEEMRLQRSVRAARSLGVPILYLADALGVSRSRIRVLARDSR